MIGRALAPYAVGALVATHAGVWWWGWDTRGDREAARVEAAQAALRVAHARIEGLAEAQARTQAERERLQQELDHAATLDPDADRVCLGPDSVFRLGGR